MNSDLERLLELHRDYVIGELNDEREYHNLKSAISDVLDNHSYFLMCPKCYTTTNCLFDGLCTKCFDITKYVEKE